jgi:replicative DNA helicase
MALDPDPAKDIGLLSNLDAEQALLGAILYDNNALERVDDALQPEHFYEPFHQRMFAEMAAIIRSGRLAEPPLLEPKFRGDNGYEDLGGFRYLAALIDRAPPAPNAADYAAAVLDCARRRRLAEIGAEAWSAAKDFSVPAAELIEQTESALFSLAERETTGRSLTAFSVSVTEAVQNIAAAHDRDGGLSGLSTGLADLDAKTGGLHPSDLIIIGARPSMGKSALAGRIAYHNASRFQAAAQPDGSVKTVAGGKTALFSLEMDRSQFAHRILADVAGVSGERLRRGQIDPTEFGRVRDAAVEIQSIPLFIDDTGAISIAKLAARARRMKRMEGLDLIIVDYLQLMTASYARRDANRVEALSEISGGLKALAKELHVPVVALAQLSRQVEQRDDKKPQLADLRESGSIEQDADVVMFLYREAYYLSRLEPKTGTDDHLRWEDQMAACRGQADIIIGKQRHGPIGSVKVAFNESTTSFGNLAREADDAFRQKGIDFSKARNPAGADA